MPPVIDARDVSRTLSLGDTPVPILHGVSFTVDRGEWVAVTGPSGSGKSTLLGIVAGLDAPTSGTVAIDGVDVSSRSEAELARIRNEKVGVVFQSFNLIPTLTAQENVEAPLYVGPHRREAKARARAMLDRVGLSDRLGHRPHQLSGGQQQRVAIARALVTEPALVVADEPTGNLDAATSAAVLDLFADLRRDLGLTVLVVTHDPDVAARADRVIHLVDGRIATDTRRAA
ncbi:ABC transporter ATP-binding protein [Rubrivirga sp. IMCC43871]|uniref:ABC transporter ATP-binding protein n=1 Tax=Rubrivirga sp. IMCC43871 TaxID=3391575 RepID=UPI00398FBCCE